MISPRDLKILKRRHDKTLAKWWCVLNIWNCPKEFKSMPSNGYKRRVGIMNWISNKITEKECLREWRKFIK